MLKRKRNDSKVYWLIPASLEMLEPLNKVTTPVVHYEEKKPDNDVIKGYKETQKCPLVISLLIL